MPSLSQDVFDIMMKSSQVRFHLRYFWFLDASQRSSFVAADGKSTSLFNWFSFSDGARRDSRNPAAAGKQG